MIGIVVVANWDREPAGSGLARATSDSNPRYFEGRTNHDMSSSRRKPSPAQTRLEALKIVSKGIVSAISHRWHPRSGRRRAACEASI